MTLLENELAHRDAAAPGGLELRADPLRVRWVLSDLFTADDHDLRLTFTASVRALDNAIERRTLAEVLLNGRPRLTAADVSTHFAPTLRSAAAAVTPSRGIEAWIAPDARGELVEALKQAAHKVAFTCGLEVLAPFELEVESRSHEQERLRKMQRALAERQAAGQAEHLARAGELLKKFQELRQSAPELSAAQVLDQINPVERGTMLQTLLLAEAKQQAAMDLWAVAGEYLVKIDARGDGPPRTALNPLPPTLGPLRSVQPAVVRERRVLLVGARGGFMVVDRAGGREPELYADAAVESQLGFSRVVFQPALNQFVGCHGEAGIVRWALGHTAAPLTTFRPERFTPRGGAPVTPTVASTVSMVGSRAPGPRNLQVLDDSRLIFSVGNRLWVMEGDDFVELESQSPAEVLAIVPTDRQMLIVHEDGTLCAMDRTSRQPVCTQRRGGQVRAAGSLPWLGGSRLLVAGEEGPVECVALDDPLVTQYASPYRGLRVVTGSADLVAAVAADRQRLVLWHSWDGRQPSAEVYLTALTRHRVADLEFG